MYQQILVPTDGSACAEAAIAAALPLAKQLGSDVAFLYVMNTVPVVREGVVNFEEALEVLRVQGRTIMDRAMLAAESAGVRARGELMEGIPELVIVREAEAFDLVVMGSHGKGVLRRVLLGSVTQAVLHRIRTPLLVVPGAGGER
jgi:nucleotide-binding universal stress UspA family protein